MEILGSFLPRNKFTFYRNNIVFGIKLQLRSFSIKRCYSFRPIASYRDARDEETHAHTHAHLFLVKWFVTLSEIACRLPGFQRGKDRITIIGKSVGVYSPGNITSMLVPVTLWYESITQTSLYKTAVSPEPVLLVHTKLVDKLNWSLYT